MRRQLTVSLLLHATAGAALLALPAGRLAAPDEPPQIEVVFGISHGYTPVESAAPAGGSPAPAAAEAAGPLAAATASALPGPGSVVMMQPKAATADTDPILRLQHADPSAIPAQGDPGNRNPTYPEAASRHGEQGTVVVRLHIGADGNVAWVETIDSSGYADLDEAAERTLLNWHFRPARRNGVDVPYVRDQPVSFVLTLDKAKW